jgi:hypothetical protein
MMKCLGGFIIEYIKWFFHVEKCLDVPNKWNKMEVLTIRYLFLQEKQLENWKNILGEIGKVFALHREISDKEKGRLVEDVQNELIKVYCEWNHREQHH